MRNAPERVPMRAFGAPILRRENTLGGSNARLRRATLQPCTCLKRAQCAPSALPQSVGYGRRSADTTEGGSIPPPAGCVDAVWILRDLLPTNGRHLPHGAQRPLQSRNRRPQIIHKLTIETHMHDSSIVYFLSTGKPFPDIHIRHRT